MISECFQTALGPAQTAFVIGVIVAGAWMIYEYKLTLWQTIQVTIGVKRLVLGRKEWIASVVFGAIFFGLIALAYHQCAPDLVTAR